jgi:hypothetical protein
MGKPIISKRLIFRRALVCVIAFMGLSFIPLGRGPSLAGWVQACIRGIGKPQFCLPLMPGDREDFLKPHFPIPGTPESRIEDFLKRHPDLRPVWREVPDDVNGFLLLRNFVNSEAAARIALSDSLSAMLQDPAKWDQNAAREHVEKHREALSELRRISLLPDRSSKGRNWDEYLEAKPKMKMSDVLLLSFQQHLRAHQMLEALTDFAALHGFAAHMDRHEVPDFVDKTVGILVRLALYKSLREELKNLPADTDWSPWISILESEPSYEKQMEVVLISEAWFGIHFIQGMTKEGNPRNPIWDFTEFEDAYANRVRVTAKSFAKGRILTDLSSLRKMEESYRKREASLSRGARHTLERTFPNMEAWTKGAIRAEAQYAFTLAALQLLQSEHTGGPITSAADPRLAAIAIDPSNAKPFRFDPAIRQLSAAPDSALMESKVFSVQLPQR